MALDGIDNCKLVESWESSLESIFDVSNEIALSTIIIVISKTTNELSF